MSENKKFWPGERPVLQRSKANCPLLFKLFHFDPSGAVCWGGTLHIPALWLQNATPALRIRFGTLRQWCVEFLPRIFYSFWAPRSKITNLSSWSACDQMVLLTGVRPKPGFGTFVVRLWVKFSKFWPEETSDLYANGPESFPLGVFTYFAGPHDQKLRFGILTGVRPKPGFAPFDRHATISLSQYFWPMVRLMVG